MTEILWQKSLRRTRRKSAGRPAERGAMKKNPQGKRWHRLDNTGKIFPMIANENLSNVFRISVTLKEEIDPGLLGQALEEVLPWFGGFKVKLKRGFF